MTFHFMVIFVLFCFPWILFIRTIMVWSEQKGVKLLRAMKAEGVFVTNKRGSQERGVVWQNVASVLFADSLTVNARGRKRPVPSTCKKWREKVRRQENESGGGDEQLTEVEILLEELVEIENESEKKAEQEGDGHKKAVAEEKKKATELREREHWRGLARLERGMSMKNQKMMKRKRNLNEDDQVER